MPDQERILSLSLPGLHWPLALSPGEFSLSHVCGSLAPGGGGRGRRAGGGLKADADAPEPPRAISAGPQYIVAAAQVSRKHLVAPASRCARKISKKPERAWMRVT